MKQEKIIFLDIDGPMIPYRCMFMPGQTVPWTVFDPVAVSMLNQLCKENGWKIVIHSTWIQVLGGMATRDHCIAQGIGPNHFHSHAWCDEREYHRWTRVARWLNDHPETETYIMLDDDEYSPDENYPHPANMADHLRQINYYTGMMFKDYNAVRAKDAEVAYSEVG